MRGASWTSWTTPHAGTWLERGVIHIISIFFSFCLRPNILHGYTKHHWDVFERILPCVKSKTHICEGKFLVHRMQWHWLRPLCRCVLSSLGLHVLPAMRSVWNNCKNYSFDFC